MQQGHVVAAVLPFVLLLCFYADVTLAQALTCPEEVGTKSFVQRQLVSKTSCEMLTRDECLFIHEARDKCPCTCQRIVSSPEAAHPQSVEYAQQDMYAGDGGGGARCFPSDALVDTNLGPMTMEQLITNRQAKVLARNKEQRLTYSPVMSWIHANKKQYAEYVDVITETNHRLSLTPLHLIYETNCKGGLTKTVMAKQLTKGNCLYVQGENGQLREARIVELKKAEKKGFYSPITEEGNLIVNGVLASCFSTIGDETLVKLALQYAFWVQHIAAKLLPQAMYEYTFGSVGTTTVEISSLLRSLIGISKYFVS
ncbi:hint module superfamily [Trichuris trichiura]|uniref:Hint module superfamily n=1 Tax=Trichuris trichiura TaxID=36087 RepID=A0A077ZEJ5_TRITR|nr:hint module superfamily [Trichuris trichiura]